MKKNVRRKIFYLLVLVFLLVSPVLIAYTLGYTFDFSKKMIARVGGIFIKSKTSRLSIFLNNQFEKETSILSGGALLTGKLPGIYLLRIEKIGYQPWSKTITVLPGFVTELRDVLLVPASPVPATSTPEEVAYFSFNPASSYQLDRKKNLVRKTGGVTKKMASDVRYFGVVGDKVFFINNNGFLAKVDPLQGSIETLGRPGFYIGDVPFKFMGSPDGKFAVMDSAGGVYLPDSAGVILPLVTGISDAYFDEEEKKLLLVKDYQVEVLWLEDNPRQPFQKKGARELVLQTSSKIQDARWYFDDNAHILIRSQDGLYLTETESRGGRNTFELYPGRTDGIYTTPVHANAIFFKKNKNIYKIEL